MIFCRLRVSGLRTTAGRPGSEQGENAVRRRSLLGLCLCGFALAAGVAWWSGRTQAQELEVAPPAPSGNPADALPPVAPPPSSEVQGKKVQGTESHADPRPLAPLPPPAAIENSVKDTTSDPMNTAAAPASTPAMTKVEPEKPAVLVPVGQAESGPAQPPGKPTAFRLVGANGPAGIPVVGAPEPIAARRIALADNPVVGGASPPHVPALAMEKFGPPTLTLGEPYTYEIVIQNLGAAPALDVRLVDLLPAGAEFLGADPKPERLDGQLAWPLGSLDAGAVRRVRCTIQLAGPVERLPVSQLAFAAGPSAGVQTTFPQVAVKAAGPETAAVGQPAVFTIEVTNPSGVPLSGLMLRAHLSPGLGHERGADIEADLAPLAPKETRKISLPTRAAQAGPQQLECSVLAKDGKQAVAKAVVQVTGPELHVRLTGPAAGLIGHEAEFHVEVSNRGNGPANNVDVSDFLPAGLEFSTAGEGGVYNATTRSVTWQMAILAPGQARGMSMKLVPHAAGDLHNPVRARCEEGAEAKDEVSLHAEGVSALRVEILNKDSQVEVGAETTYELRVSNQGSVPGSGVQVLATVPDGLEPVGAEGPTSYRINGQQVQFEPVDKVLAGSAVEFRIRAKGTKAGDWRFKAQLTSDQQPRPVYQEESTLVYQAGK
jgi:uncharacterized repeat protein (TIGR01451 family)